jgi:thiamine-monophosphate kinase
VKLSSLGERKIIEIFKKQFERRECRDVLVSIGDDCAVIKLGGGDCLLVSIDTMCEETHIPREMKAGQIGMYAVNAVLSDIAAMGGSPLGMVFSIALPPHLESDFVLEISKGMEMAAKVHGTCIIGGDTQEAEKITITGTGLGKVHEKNLLLRSSARVGDLICVTGEIGSAAAGFYCLTKNIKGYKRLVRRALEPVARFKEAGIISGYASSCTDISDGLAWSLHEITHQSKVGSRLYEKQIPVDSALPEIESASGVLQKEMVLYMGGDFELLFTISPKKYKEFKAEGLEVTVIGEITEIGNKIIDKQGIEGELEKTKGIRIYLYRLGGQYVL